MSGHDGIPGGNPARKGVQQWLPLHPDTDVRELVRQCQSVSSSLSSSRSLSCCPLPSITTTTKPSDYRPDPSILTWWSALFEIPCVAIGGITADNAKPLVAAGADFLAVCQAVWGADDPAEAVRRFAGALEG